MSAAVAPAERLAAATAPVPKRRLRSPASSHRMLSNAASLVTTQAHQAANLVVQPIERAARAAVTEAKHHKRPWLCSLRFWRSATGKELLFYLCVIAAVSTAVSWTSIYAAEESVGIAIDAQLSAALARMSATAHAFLATAATVNALNERALARNATGLRADRGDAPEYLLAQLEIYPMLTSVGVAWPDAADGALQAFSNGTTTTATSTATTANGTDGVTTFSASGRGVRGAHTWVDVDLSLLSAELDAAAAQQGLEWAVLDAASAAVVFGEGASDSVLAEGLASLLAEYGSLTAPGALGVHTTGDWEGTVLTGVATLGYRGADAWVVLVAAPKAGFFAFVDSAELQTALATVLAAALLVWIVYTERYGGLRTRKIDTRRMFRAALDRSKSVHLDRVDRLSDDVDYAAYYIGGIIVMLAVVVTVLWQTETNLASTELARAVAEQLEDLTASTLNEVLTSHTQAELQLRADERRRGHLVDFAALPVVGDPAATHVAAACPYELPRDFLTYLTDTTEAYREEHPHAVNFFGAVFDNECVAFATTSPAHAPDSLLLADASTADHGVGVLESRPSRRELMQPLALGETLPWLALSSEAPAWSKVFLYDEALLDDFGLALLSRGGANATLAVGLTLPFVSAKLVEALEPLGLGSSAYAFVTDDTGYLAAATEGSVITAYGERLPANASAHAGTAATATQLQAMLIDSGRGPLEAFAAEVRFGSRRTWARAALFEHEYGLQWQHTVAVERAIIDVDIQNWNAVSLLVASGLVMLSLYVIRGLHLLRGRDDESDAALREADRHDAAYWRRVAFALARDVAMASAGCEPGVDKFERARRYIADSFRVEDRHVIDTLNVQARNRPGARLSRERLYHAYTSTAYRRFVEAAIVVHSAVCFYEAPSAGVQSEGYPRGLLVVQAACIVVHLLDTAVYLHLFGTRVRGARSVSNKQAAKRLRLSKRFALRALLVAAMALDWLALWRYDYTRDWVPYTYAYIRTHLTYSSPLRPLLLIPRNKEIELSLNNFLVTLILAKDVLVVGLSFLVVTTASAVTLLSDVCYEDELGRHVADWRSAAILTFVYVFTGENFPSAVHPATDTDNCAAASGAFRTYFIVVSFIGIFLLVSLVVGSFQRSYSTRLRAVKMRQDKEHRLSMIVAFLVLSYREEKTEDKGRRLTVSPDEFRPFLAYCGVRPDTTARGHAVLAITRRLEVLSFVDIVETLMSDPAHRSTLFADPHASAYAFYRQLVTRLQGMSCPALARVRHALRAAKDSDHYDHVVLAIVLANLWTMCLVGTHVARDALSTLAPLFVYVNALETLTRIIVYGPWAFLFKYHTDDPLRRSAHQFDLLVTLCSVGVFVLTRVSAGAYALPPASPEQVALAMPALRLFTIVQTNKRLIFGLLAVLKGFWALLVLLFIVVFVFSVVATFVFCGLFTYMGADQYDLPESNFDSMPEAVTTFYQMAIGESWDSVMLAAVDSKYGLGAALFFCGYALFLSVLFSQLFIGIVCDAYEKLNELLKQAAKADAGAKMLAITAFTEGVQQHRRARAASLVDSRAAQAAAKAAADAHNTGRHRHAALVVAAAAAAAASRPKPLLRQALHPATPHTPQTPHTPAGANALATTPHAGGPHHAHHTPGPEPHTPLGAELAATTPQTPAERQQQEAQPMILPHAHLATLPPLDAPRLSQAAQTNAAAAPEGADVVIVDLATEEPETVLTLDSETAARAGCHLWAFRPGSVAADEQQPDGLAADAQRMLYGERAEVFHFVSGCKVPTIAWHVGMLAKPGREVRVRVLSQDPGLRALLGLCCAYCHIELYEHVDAMLFTLTKYRRKPSRGQREEARRKASA